MSLRKRRKRPDVTETKTLLLSLSRIGSSAKRSVGRPCTLSSKYGAVRSFGIPNLDGDMSIHSKNEDPVAIFFYDKPGFAKRQIGENQFLFVQILWQETSLGSEAKSGL